MNTLTNRFREVTVTLGDQSALPAQPPSSWLRLEQADSVVRFVHSNVEEATAAEVAAAFPSARDIALDPMPLRSIFLSIARSSRAPQSAAVSQPTSGVKA